MRELSEDGIEEVLTQNGVGVLSLVDEPYPYAIPMSFGYGGDEPVLAVQLGGGDGSRKGRCLERNHNVCFTVYEETAPDTWRSVVITGRLHEIPDDDSDRAFAVLAANATFPSDVRVWGVPLEEAELTLYRLAIDDCTGREFGMTHGLST